MIRRFNYSGRRRIPSSRVRIRVADEGDRRRFDAEFSLDGLGLPRGASLFVEAYHRAFHRRFDFGTVGEPHAPSARWLDGIPVRTPLFRVKVVMVEHGLADPDCDDEDWGTLWLRFACRTLGRPRPPLDAGNARDEWIEGVVNAFCVRSQVAARFGRLLADHGE